MPTLKGNGSSRSAVFDAPSSWQVYWSFVCYSEDQLGSLHITPTAANGLPVAGNKPITAQGISGFGDQPYQLGGRLYLSIQAAAGCTWQLTVKAP